MLRPHQEILAALSADEIVGVLGLTRAPRPARAAARRVLHVISRPLGGILARFDARIGTDGLAAAGAACLRDLGATLACEGPAPPSRGPLLVVANHPGAYDTMALLAAVRRDDVAIVAADRPFLRALPGLSRHLLFIPDEGAGSASERARGLRVALRHLHRGGALVHFGAGEIEPDPGFASASDGEPLGEWARGTGALVRGAARVGGAVAGALVLRVHSARAKRAWITRTAEARGVTTFAPLLQLTVPYYRRVDATLRFAPAVAAVDLLGGDDAAVTARVRDGVRALVGGMSPKGAP